MKKVEVAILGAGIAGLGAALKARELGLQYEVFESRDRAGGLLDNFSVDGFRFDYAVHLSFATEKKVREIFDKVEYFTHPAESLCFDDSVWLRHPVQNNLYPLGQEEKIDLLASFFERPNELGRDYESWLRHQYGHQIAERFPIRYTLKYWATQACDLSTTWIGNRMRRADPRELLAGALLPTTPSTYYTKEMRYPKVGGYKAFIADLIADSCIALNHEVLSIDLERKTLAFGNGESVQFDRLVSTLPLPMLCERIVRVPEDAAAAARKLVATSIDLVSVGFNRVVDKGLWFYIYDADILASRAYSPSVKSPDNAPAGCSSLQFEIYSRGVQSPYSAEELKRNVIHALKKMNIADPADIVVMDHRRINYGNVIFDLDMEIHRGVVLEYLKNRGVASCGRFGSWDYLWSNQSLLSGYEAIQ